jgi:hypothetical protein
MADYRKFWLVNSLGNRYEFTNPNHKAFLHDPNGLGFKRLITTLTIGNSELVTSRQFQLTDVSGDLLFYDDTNGDKYQKYFDFIQFAKFKPLELHYLTPNNLVAYHCDVEFIQANKTEVAEDGILHVPVTFHRLTEWLTDEDYKVTFVKETDEDGKDYPLIRDYHYKGSTFSNEVVYNDGTDDVGFIITVKGREEDGVIVSQFTNMQFSLTQGGETYGICKINGTYDLAIIDSIERTESIYLEANGSAIVNPEQYQDFTIRNGASYLTWCKMRVGETVFNFTCSDIATFDGTIEISFKKSYATV